MGFGVKRSKVKSHAMIQSRLSYATLQGTLMKRSHMTGGLLIQSPQNDLEDKQYMTS